MAYVTMGSLVVTEAQDEYAKQLDVYKRRGCEDKISKQCERDFELVVLFAERNELHAAGVRGISLDQIKKELAAGRTMIAGFPQGVIVNLLLAAKAKALIATKRNKPLKSKGAPGSVFTPAVSEPVSAASAEMIATLADKIERLEHAQKDVDRADDRAWLSEMDTRLREAARGKSRARTQSVVTPLALLAAGAIVLSVIYKVAR
ncbi:MAG: hypothetical protein E4G90_04725 [Gemmatimonadales bacterium]|nr:MAG: hypothetical protein E4G90_04725 [Gemmatimonadales bacterium]